VHCEERILEFGAQVSIEGVDQPERNPIVFKESAQVVTSRALVVPVVGNERHSGAQRRLFLPILTTPIAYFNHSTLLRVLIVGEGVVGKAFEDSKVGADGFSAKYLHQ